MIIVMFLASVAYAQNFQWQWATGTGSSSSDRASDISVDNLGNTIVTGYYSETVAFGAVNLTNPNSSDNVYVAKIGADGQWLWATSPLGGGNAYGYSVAIDANNNIYICGMFGGTFSFGTTQLSSGYSYSAFVAKVDSNGNWLWAVRPTGSNGSHQCNDIAVDAQGNVFVTGGYSGANINLGGISLPNASGYNEYWDLFVAKLDTNGNWLWAKRGGGEYNEYCQSLAVDSGGFIHITGYFYDSTSIGSTYLNGNGLYDVFVALLDINGNWQWAINGGGMNYDYCYAIATDDERNSYITGFYSSTAYFGGTQLSCSGGHDVFIAKLNANGIFQWARKIGSLYDDSGFSLAVDEEGNVFVTGYFTDSISIGSTTLSSQGQRDIFVTKMDAGGNFQWGVSAGGTHSDYGSSIFLDHNGSLYAAGYFGDWEEGQITAEFGSTLLISNGNEDMFVAKLVESPLSPPMPVSGLQISKSNGDIHLTWNPVTYALDGTPITPNLYLILYNGYNSDEDHFVVIAEVTDATSYIHHGILNSYSKGFYMVKAIRN